jgi:hypothetical protein
MKVISSINFPQHGEVFYFYGQDLQAGMLIRMYLSPNLLVLAEHIHDWSLNHLMSGDRALAKRLYNTDPQLRSSLLILSTVNCYMLTASSYFTLVIKRYLKFNRLSPASSVAC